MRNRLYMLSDSSLRSYARVIADDISANILFYAQFGITSEIIEAFRSQIELAFSISEDKIVRIDKREFYGNSCTAYNAVAHKARLFGSLLKYHLGKDAPLVLEISAKGMSPRKHDESLARAGKIHQRLTAALPDLTGSGVTQELLDDFAAAIATATAARKEYLAVKASRLPTTEYRAAAHNAVYLELVRLTDICRAALLSKGHHIDAKAMRAIPKDYLRLKKRRKTIREKKKGKLRKDKKE